jgi:hypothetical protein
MKFLLKNELSAVEAAEQTLKAKAALDRHQTLKAKACIKALLVSKRGLASAFGAGVAKGLLSSSSGSSSSGSSTGFSVSIIKQVMTVWLSAQGSSSDTSESGCS